VVVTFRGRAAVGGAVAIGAVLLSGLLDSLGTTTRAMILAAAGVTTLGVVLPSSCAPGQCSSTVSRPRAPWWT
jgi:hypothetical protein